MGERHLTPDQPKLSPANPLRKIVTSTVGGGLLLSGGVIAVAITSLRRLSEANPDLRIDMSSLLPMGMAFFVASVIGFLVIFVTTALLLYSLFCRCCRNCGDGGFLHGILGLLLQLFPTLRNLPRDASTALGMVGEKLTQAGNALNDHVAENIDITVPSVTIETYDFWEVMGPLSRFLSRPDDDDAQHNLFLIKSISPSSANPLRGVKASLSTVAEDIKTAGTNTATVSTKLGEIADVIDTLQGGQP
jgi:hypothetical protein